MALEGPNVLLGSYTKYFKKCQLKKLVAAIPQYRRKEFADDIRARMCAFGCKNKEILEAVLKELQGEDK